MTTPETTPAKPRIRRPRHIIELERIAADPEQLPQHRLRAATSLARALPKPRQPRQPELRRRELTPAEAKHLVALLAAVGTSWEDLCPSATWEQLAQAGYDRADVIAVGINPDMVRHGPPAAGFVVVKPEPDEDE